MKKELKLFGEKPMPKKAQNNGKEVILLEEYFKTKKVRGIKR